MKIINFETATKQIQLHLADYLQSKNIDTSKNFKCINPAHEDKKPSMSLIKPEGVRVFCHSCCFSGDIFDVCSILDNKPLTGQGFITDTLPVLAKQFNIELEHTELTEDEQYQLDTYRAYRHAAEYITCWSSKMPVDIETEIDRRKWKADESLQAAGVGYVNDPTHFRNHLKAIGFSATFLDDVDLGRKDIFAPGHLIFTIKDESGRPVGFAARSLSGEGPKYVNQKTTGVKCNIYQKGKRLYGLDVALKHKSEGPIYIMEGYSDVLSCHLNNFNRCVATCGTSLTDDHLLLLKEHGIYEIVLCYDNDKAGQERTEQLLDSKLTNHKDISVSVLTVPEKDPDEFIRANSIQDFINLKPISAFQWRLYRFDESVEAEIVCKRMISLIASEPSHISQEKMVQELSKFTGFSVKTLQQELDRLINEKEKTKDKERQLIVERMSRDLVAKPGEAELILSEAQTKLHNLKVKYDEDNMSVESNLRFLLESKSQQESLDGSSPGFTLGEDLIEFEKAIRGNLQGTLNIVGGSANAGKSAFLLKLAHSIAKYPNNACVIYHTIDDSKDQLLPRWICIAEGSCKLEINHVQNPRFYSGLDEIAHRRETGYKKILDLFSDGRLVLKDSTDGLDLNYAEGLIKYYQDIYPDRQIVYILDNFHKLRDFQGLNDERTRYKTMSQIIKNMAVKYQIPVFCTMEYTKLAPEIKPTNNSISESVQMEYDANLIAHIWNGSHALGDKATIDMFHTILGDQSIPTRCPIIEINIGKNKITSFKSKLYFKFFPASSDFRAQPLEVALALQEQVAAEKKGKKYNNSIDLFES